jgi:2-oxoglutarate dehydrogenase E1 component
VASPEKIQRVILCSGKVYYDLINYRTEEKITNAALVRLEQLYPLAEEKLHKILSSFSQATKIVWCQEESQNMGAWTFIEPRLRSMLRREILYAGRNASASPAVGALALHKREQACVIEEAFSL